jgi:hypothetical protein
MGSLGLISLQKGRPPKMKQPVKSKSKKSIKSLTKEEELFKENDYLRAENALLKKALGLSSSRQKIKALIELRRQHNMGISLECLQMARSSFYNYANHDSTDKYTEI